MKLRTRLIVISAVLVMISVGLTSYFTFQYVEDAITKSAIHEMTNVLQQKENQIETLHARATEDLVYTLKNPLFEEYFELPETKSRNIYKDGVMQFTPRQNEPKIKLEQAIYNFQEKFQVDETCLIDTTGQEHARRGLLSIVNHLNTDVWIMYKITDEYIQLEKDLLQKYRDDHIEMPPLNRSST